MLGSEVFCPECGRPKAVPTVLPLRDQTAPVTRGSHRPAPATTPRRRSYAGFGSCLVGAVAALAVAAIVMFTTPHASYDAYVNTAGSQQVLSTSCITAWDNMVGNLDYRPAPTEGYALRNYEAKDASCTNVVHGRQHLALVLGIFAMVLAGIAIALYPRSPA